MGVKCALRGPILSRTVLFALEILTFITAMRGDEVSIEGNYGWKRISKTPWGGFRNSIANCDDSICLFACPYTVTARPDNENMKRLYLFHKFHKEWSSVPVSGSIPPYSEGHNIITLEDYLYLFPWIPGPFPSYFRLDLATYVFEEMTYAKVSSHIDISMPTLFVHNGKIYCFGGNMRIAIDRLNHEIMALDTASSKWTILTTNNTLLSKRLLGPACYSNSKLFVLGSTNPTTQSSFLWTFSFERNSWSQLELKFSDVQKYSSAIVLGDHLFNIGGGSHGWVYDAYNQVINTETGVVEYKVNYSSECKLGEEINFPPPRMMPALLFDDLYIYMFGGGTSVYLNDIWIFSAETYRPVWSSLGVYPFPRARSSWMKVDEKRAVMFGGSTISPYYPFDVLNDIWEFNIENHEWGLISQERYCILNDPTCGPQVVLAAVGYFNNTIFVIGGESILASATPVSKKFSMETKSWSFLDLSFDTPTSSFWELRRQSYLGIGSKFYIWSGLNSTSLQLVQTPVWVLDMTTLTISTLPSTGEVPTPREHANTFSWGEDMCVGGTRLGYRDSHRLWCYSAQKKTWYKFPLISTWVDNSVQYGYFIMDNLVSYLKPSSASMVFQTHTGSQIFTLPHRYRYMEALSEVSMAIFGTKAVILSSTSGYFYTPVYQIDFANYFCKSLSDLTVSKDTILDDGSQMFRLFPGTDCTWIVRNTSWVEILSLELSEGSHFTIESIGPLEQSLESSDQLHSKVSMGHDTVGAVGSILHFQSKTLFVKISIPIQAKSAQGFTIRLYACSSGFSVLNGECLCPSERLITAFGDCVPQLFLPPPTNQPSFQLKLKEPRSKVGTSFDMVSHPYLSPHHKTISLLGKIFRIQLDPLQLMDGAVQVLVKNSTDLYHWDVLQVKNQPPRFSSGSCGIGLNDSIFLVGGLAGHDFNTDFYTLNVGTGMWTVLPPSPASDVVGHMCQSYQGGIYFHGGESAKRGLLKSTWKYQDDTWTLVSENGPALRDGVMVSYNNSLWMFAGSNEIQDSADVWLFNHDRDWYRLSPLTTSQGFSETTSRNILSSIARKMMFAAQFQGELHIYGGVSSHGILSDSIVISLGYEPKVIFYRPGKRLDEQESFHSPVPLYGGSFIEHGNRMYLGGGFSLFDEFVSVEWLWDTETRTWVGASLWSSPIQRMDAGFTLWKQELYILFGGAVKYSTHVFLNDLWLFNANASSWTMLSAHTLDGSFPPPRSLMGLTVWNDDVYIFGGETGNTIPEQNLWMFSIAERRWSNVAVKSTLRISENPFSRIDFGFTCKECTCWMYGGKTRVPTLLEDYTSVIEINLDSMHVSARTTGAPLPSARVKNVLVEFKDSLWLFGGRSFGGLNLQDIWKFNLEKGMWNRIQTQLPLDFESHGAHGAILDRFAVLFSGHKTILFDFDQQYLKELLMESKHENSVLVGGFSVASSLSVLLVFGGQLTDSVSNSVFSYVPGFCSNSTITEISGSYATQSFDDGSSFSPYLPSSSCAWRVSGSNRIRISYDISERDHLSIIPHESGDIGTRILNGTGHAELDLFEGGFNLLLSASSEPKERDYNGFLLYHTVCPLDATYNTTIGCVCPIGMYLDTKASQCVICDEDDPVHKCPGNEAASPVFVLLTIAISAVVALTIFLAAYFIISFQRKAIRLKKYKMRQILLINDGELDIIDAIGEGTTAQVYKGRFRTALVAVKQYTQRAFLPWELNTVVSYVEPLINIRHPSIVLYLGVYLDGCKLFIVEEYMEKGSLRDLLSNPNLKISSSIRTETWKSIIRGLMYLHSYDPLIVHPNFNSPNILISANWNAKISDFQIHPIEATRASPDLESEGIYWAAPETITSLEITPSSNVYSLGIVTWELLTRDMPYHDEPPSVDLAFQISGNGRRPEIPSSCHYDLRCCLERMWSNDQARRPSLDEIMEVVEIIEKDESIFSERSSKIVKLKMKESLSEQVQGFVIVCIRVLFQTSLKKLINCEQALAGTASTAFIEKLVHSFNGRIIPANQSFWWCEFKDTADAILFCCDALRELKQYHEEWKHSIHPNSTEQQENYECIVNIGIDKRWRLRDPNSSTSSREYSDKLPERAMALCKLCRGDQILCSSPIFSDFELNERRMPVHVKAKANTSNIQAYEIIPVSRLNSMLSMEIPENETKSRSNSETKKRSQSSSSRKAAGLGVWTEDLTKPKT